MQFPSCRKCNGKRTDCKSIQVRDIDLKVKYFSNCSIQCELGKSPVEMESKMCQTFAEQIQSCDISNEVSFCKADVTTVKLNSLYSQNSVQTDQCIVHQHQDIIDESHEMADNSSNANVDINEFNDDVYKEFCRAKLCDPELMSKLIEVLHETASLNDFIQLVTQLADGHTDLMNMSFLLCLEVARLQNCKSTTNMQLRKETHQFWEVLYRTCHGRGLHLFAGSKNQGFSIYSKRHL